MAHHVRSEGGGGVGSGGDSRRSKNDIIIVGGGIAALATAHYLVKQNCLSRIRIYYEEVDIGGADREIHVPQQYNERPGSDSYEQISASSKSIHDVHSGYMDTRFHVLSNAHTCWNLFGEVPLWPKDDSTFVTASNVNLLSSTRSPGAFKAAPLSLPSQIITRRTPMVHPNVAACKQITRPLSRGIRSRGYRSPLASKASSSSSLSSSWWNPHDWKWVKKARATYRGDYLPQPGDVCTVRDNWTRHDVEFPIITLLNQVDTRKEDMYYGRVTTFLRYFIRHANLDVLNQLCYIITISEQRLQAELGNVSWSDFLMLSTDNRLDAQAQKYWIDLGILLTTGVGSHYSESAANTSASAVAQELTRLFWQCQRMKATIRGGMPIGVWMPNKPTLSQTLFEPWKMYLESCGVEFYSQVTFGGIRDHRSAFETGHRQRKPLTELLGLPTSHLIAQDEIIVDDIQVNGEWVGGGWFVMTLPLDSFQKVLQQSTTDSSSSSSSITRILPSINELKTLMSSSVVSSTTLVELDWITSTPIRMIDTNRLDDESDDPQQPPQQRSPFILVVDTPWQILIREKQASSTRDNSTTTEQDPTSIHLTTWVVQLTHPPPASSSMSDVALVTEIMTQLAQSSHFQSRSRDDTNLPFPDRWRVTRDDQQTRPLPTAGSWARRPTIRMPRFPNFFVASPWARPPTLSRRGEDMSLETAACNGVAAARYIIHYNAQLDRPVTKRTHPTEYQLAPYYPRRSLVSTSASMVLWPLHAVDAVLFRCKMLHVSNMFKGSNRSTLFLLGYLVCFILVVSFITVVLLQRL